MGSMYINDFPNQGRMQQVIVQVEAKSRMQLKDILNLESHGFKRSISLIIRSCNATME